MRRFCTFIILFTFIGCATYTSRESFEAYKKEKNYSKIISACGEREHVGGKPDVKVKAEAQEFILGNKNEAKQHVIDAISNGSGDLRAGGTEIANKWPDRDFIEPLFKAFADENSSRDDAKMMRVFITSSWLSYSSVLKDKEKKEMALKIAAKLKEENNVQVLHFIVKAVKDFAVPETYSSLAAFNDEVFVKKTRKLDSIGGPQGGRSYILMIHSNIRDVQKVMAKDESGKTDSKKKN